MKDTRVLFSFGSRHGGLELALKLRQKLVSLPDWAGRHAYIDMENLKSHPETRVEGTKVLNPHWAEFYYMGLLITDVCVCLASNCTEACIPILCSIL